MTDLNRQPASTAPRTPGVPNKLDYLGLGAGLIPFALSIRSSQSRTDSTTVTDSAGNQTTTTSGTSEFSDPIALTGGGLAVIIALILLAGIGNVAKAKRMQRVGWALVILALGAYQLVVRGGLFS